MDFLELAKARYSVRKFSDKKVETQKIDLILEAGRVAPTACNFQPQRILVIDKETGLEKLKKCTPYHFDAPLAMLVCYDKNASWKRKYDDADGGQIDASIVTTHMMLEVTNLGLGTTWVGSFNPQAVREEFALPENIIPIAILPIGYPSDDCEPYSGHFQRLEKEKTVFRNPFS